MKTVTVQRCHTLWVISQRSGVTVAQIKAFNGLKSDALSIGQVLKVSAATPSVVAPLPVSDGTPDWYYPVLPWSRYNNNAGRFLDPVYYNQLGAVHPGVDLNGNGGGNTDFGDAVYAASDGIVVDARWYPVWGYIVKIWHPADRVWTVYGHLARMYVSIGMSVKGGKVIGTIGKGEGNRYLAHLHFEIRKADLPTDVWPSGRYRNRWQAEQFTKDNYHSPIVYLQNKGARTSL